MLKLLCVSDTVMPQMESATNLRRRYHDIDLVISCGDMPSVYLEFITSVLSVPLFYVRGNHDERYTHEPPGGTNLHKRIVNYKGINFAGLEGSMKYNRENVQYSEFEMLRMVVGMAPQIAFNRIRQQTPVDILVAHSPPRGIHDATDLPHMGFQSLLRFMDWYKPRYMLHGHVHTYDRRKQTHSVYGDTQVINVNPVTVLDID